jgi:hypothetical protein
MYKTCQTFFYLTFCKKDTLFKLVMQNFFKKDHSIHLHFTLVILIHTRFSIIYMQKMSLFELRKMKIKVHFNEIDVKIFNEIE